MVQITVDFLKKKRARFTELKNETSSYKPVWTDIRDYIGPRTARFEGEQTRRGERQDEKIINSAPRMAARTLASGMHSGITSPLRPWFKLGTQDPDLQAFGPVAKWLADVEEIIRTLFFRSNIYDRLKSTYHTLGLYGTSCLWIENDDDTFLRAHDLLTGTFYIAENASGRVDTLYREISMTAVQMIDKFGRNKVKPQVTIAFDNGHYQQEFDVVHLVEPNPDFQEGRENPKFKKFISLWMNEDMSTMDDVLREGGFDDIPFMAPRWDLVGVNAYGIGPGELALGDAKQLQLMEKRKLQGVDKNVRPPMVADASMRNERTSVLPGSTTYVNGFTGGSGGYRPAYEINPMIPEMDNSIRVINDRIDEAFHKNLFQVITDLGDQPNITATQISAIREEKLLMLGPVLERLNDELLDVLIDRAFNRALKLGLLPPIPDELAGTDLKIEYISILAQAQKAQRIGNIERFISFTGGISELAPDAFDLIDTDEVILEYADSVSLPPKLIRDEQDVETIREARAEQAQAREDVEAAGAIGSLAKDLSAAETGDVATATALGLTGGG